VPSADVDLVLLAVPDGAVADAASRVERSAAVVAHCSGSSTLEVLAPHRFVGSVHPLVSLRSPESGSERLRGAWFAVAGDPDRGQQVVTDVVESLEGRSVEVPDEHRARYHATAAVASNHLVALLGQVERLAADIDVPVAAYHALIAGTVANVESVGAAAALTGPVARGDWDTVRRHVAALPADERDTYLALARSAARLAGRSLPDDLDAPT